MAVPALTEHGLLPEGIHDGSMAEARSRFGAFQGSDRRPQLWKTLDGFLREVAASELVEAVLLNGSFVTAKPAPNDIDLILVVSAAHDFSVDLPPVASNVLSKRRVARRYGLDLLVARAGSVELEHYLRFFQQVRLEPGKRTAYLGHSDD